MFEVFKLIERSELTQVVFWGPLYIASYGEKGGKRAMAIGFMTKVLRGFLNPNLRCITCIELLGPMNEFKRSKDHVNFRSGWTGDLKL